MAALFSVAGRIIRGPPSRIAHWATHVVTAGTRQCLPTSGNQMRYRCPINSGFQGYSWVSAVTTCVQRSAGPRRVAAVCRWQVLRRCCWRHAAMGGRLATSPGSDAIVGVMTSHARHSAVRHLNPHHRSRGAGLMVSWVGGRGGVAGVGGGLHCCCAPDTRSRTTRCRALQPAASQSAANISAGSVEQVAAKVVPSVVELQTDSGNRSYEDRASS